MQGHPGGGWPQGGWQQAQGGYPQPQPQRPAGPPKPWAALISHPGPFYGLHGFQQTLVYQQRAPIDTIAGEIAWLRSFDRHVEAERKKYGWRTFWGFLGFGLFLLPVAVFPPVVVLSLALLVFAIVNLRKWKRQKAVDVENRRYELVARLLELLRSDADPRQPIALHLDLREATHGDKLRQKYKVDPWTIERYADEWLWLRVILADGSRLTLTMTEKLMKKSGWKRGYSGKLKYKTKQRARTLAGVELLPRTKKLARFDEIAAQVQQAVQLPGYAVPRRVQARDGCIDLRAEIKGEWQEGAGPGGVRPSVVFAAMMMSVYQPVLLSRELQRRARKAGA